VVHAFLIILSEPPVQVHLELGQGESNLLADRNPIELFEHGLEEFRRRTKTRASLPNEEAVVLLLFGLLRTGQIRLRRFDGWKEMPTMPRVNEKQAA